MKIIAFEGIDGSGKTTQSKRLYEKLKEELESPVHLYECCSKDNLWGRIITHIYRTESNGILRNIAKPRAIQELLYSLCAQANIKKISLSPDSLVVSDRSILTAYASHYGKLPSWYISLLEPRIIPDFVFFLNIQPEEGLERIAEREIKLRDEEMESLIDFRDTYFDLMECHRPQCLTKTEFRVIDGHQTIEAVHQQVREGLDEYLKKNLEKLRI